MTLPRFHSRISNALGPLVAQPHNLLEFLKNRSVCLRAAGFVADDASHRAGFLLVANLSSRLYARIRVDAPSELADEVAALILSINPNCEVDCSGKQSDAELIWDNKAKADISKVTIFPEAWSVHIDAPGSVDRGTNPLSALAAAAIGTGELFKAVFSPFLLTGRATPSPSRFDLLEINGSSIPPLPAEIAVGRIHLAGVGAIGQAFVHALSYLPAAGTLVLVDPESIDVFNLQRYILAADSDVGASKCEIAARALSNSRLKTESIQNAWGENGLTTDAECVCTALDTSAARIAVQAGLPKRVYNAWTQPADTGWSRHEQFGAEACLACLYVPTGSRPSQHELISQALKQSALRVLAYLIFRVPVDQPLQTSQIPKLPNLPTPVEAPSWAERSILFDIVESLELDQDAALIWKGREISALYREGICGGTIVSDRVGELSREVIVPLAHQSALAGTMLATNLVVSCCPDLLRHRPQEIEGRLNVLSDLRQVTARPRQRTPGCICSDPFFLTRYSEKWSLR